VQTKIQCWLFDLTCSLKQWQIKEEKHAQLINILTKDIEGFSANAWAYPYLMAVVVNTIVSSIFLFNMFGAVIVVCYIAMAALLALQYYTNAKIADLRYKAQKLADQRV